MCLYLSLFRSFFLFPYSLFFKSSLSLSVGAYVFVSFFVQAFNPFLSLSKPDSLIFGFFQFSVGWSVMEVEISNAWVLDYGFGCRWRWRWRWRWLVLVGEGWVFLGLVGVVIFVEEGWVFLGLIEVEIGGRFCIIQLIVTWTELRPSGFGAVDGELMVDLGLLTADLVLLMADLVLLIGGVVFDEVLGWRFDDFSGLVFSCWFWFGFDEFFMFWRFRWRIGILYEILHCFGFDCSWILKNKLLCSQLKK